MRDYPMFFPNLPLSNKASPREYIRNPEPTAPQILPRCHTVRFMRRQSYQLQTIQIPQ